MNTFELKKRKSMNYGDAFNRPCEAIILVVLMSNQNRRETQRTLDHSNPSEDECCWPLQVCSSVCLINVDVSHKVHVSFSLSLYIDYAILVVEFLLALVEKKSRRAQHVRRETGHRLTNAFYAGSLCRRVAADGDLWDQWKSLWRQRHVAKGLLGLTRDSFSSEVPDRWRSPETFNRLRMEMSSDGLIFIQLVIWHQIEFQIIVFLVRESRDTCVSLMQSTSETRTSTMKAVVSRRRFASFLSFFSASLHCLLLPMCVYISTDVIRLWWLTSSRHSRAAIDKQ